MTNITDLKSHFEMATGFNKPKLDGKPPGGDDGGMETRVAALEAAVTQTGSRLTHIDTKLGHMDTVLAAASAEIKQFKWWLLGAAVSMFLAILATSISIQQMTVSTFVAAGQAAREAQGTPQPTVVVVPAQPAASANR